MNPLFPEAQNAVEFDKSRIDRVVLRIVRGLFRHHYPSIILDSKVKLSVEMFYRNQDKDETLRTLKREEIGGDIFRYWRGLANSDLRESIWALAFYDQTLFSVSTEVVT